MFPVPAILESCTINSRLVTGYVYLDGVAGRCDLSSPVSTDLYSSWHIGSLCGHSCCGLERPCIE